MCSRILVESVSLDVTVKWFLHIGSVLGCCLYGLIGYRIGICKFSIEHFVKLRETKNLYQRSHSLDKTSALLTLRGVYQVEVYGVNDVECLL